MKHPQLPHLHLFSTALNEILDRRGLPSMNHGRVDAFAALMGNRPSSTVHRWIAGRSVPSIDTLLEMAQVLDCSLDELFGRSIEPSRIPVVNATYFSDSLTANIQVPQVLIDRRNRVGPFGILRVSGNEMDGLLSNNDWAIFDMGQTEICSSCCYVLEVAGKMIVRRLRVSMSQRIEVLCDNTFYPPETLERSQFVPYDEKQTVQSSESPPILIRGLVIAFHRFQY